MAKGAIRKPKKQAKARRRRKLVKKGSYSGSATKFGIARKERREERDHKELTRILGREQMEGMW